MDQGRNPAVSFYIDSCVSSNFEVPFVRNFIRILDYKFLFELWIATFYSIYKLEMFYSKFELEHFVLANISNFFQYILTFCSNFAFGLKIMFKILLSMSYAHFHWNIFLNISFESNLDSSVDVSVDFLFELEQFLPLLWLVKLCVCSLCLSFLFLYGFKIEQRILKKMKFIFCPKYICPLVSCHSIYSKDKLEQMS